VFGNDDQIIEVAGGGGNDISQVNNIKAFAPDTGITFTEDEEENTATSRITNNLTIDILAADPPEDEGEPGYWDGITETELMKVLVYENVDEDGNTLRVPMPSGRTDHNMHALMKDIDHLISLESNLSIARSETVLRVYFDNLEQSVNVETFEYDDFPDPGNQYTQLDMINLGRDWPNIDPEPSNGTQETTFESDIVSLNDIDSVTKGERFTISYGYYITILLRTEGNGVEPTGEDPDPEMQILNTTEVTFKKDPIKFERFIF